MKPKIGLALSGGGAKGFAHIGVIKSLKKHGIKIDVISGVSAGALVGGIYASGTSIEKLEEICYSSGYTDFIKLMFNPSRKKGGLIGSRKIGEFIKSNISERKIENFPIKFACTAVDLKRGKPFYFKTGDITTAIRSSIALPGIFKPISHKGMYLVDGGILEPISLGLVKKLGGQVNIASDLNRYIIDKRSSKNKRFNIKNVVHLSLILLEKKISDLEFEKNRDFLRVKPNVSNIGVLQFGSNTVVEKAIKEGERVMDQSITEVKKMIKSYQRD